ncbi:glycosyl hydrolase family 10 [Colletotrichum graminicola]|uniref:Beta-xylanase n=1 Tax=Colletotrichum graminicola (strain M1.001 / M2 / FGSC 10212) TaxID=645133 RepID=E3QQ83_COLGM|nr:glycosyl hydrolase family 10 [Colletotrichum graminicola M1.001]EFQ33021.1 glycosyl hydrolase family 10 [Colletotrichum graminicola M1.001]WDK09218.1 glycosyl hydrolase family 10 [Colletotrichum graminicola]
MRFSPATLAGLLAIADHASADGLHELAVKAGKKYFGTATDNPELSDSAYTAITKDSTLFGQITPGNGQKWDYVEANQGVFTYGYADVVPDFAEKNGQILRCHTLLYRAQTPQWVTNTKWTKAQMTAVITTHINNVVGHYKGQCYSWDVVNEAIDDSGNYRQDTAFYNVLGIDYIPLAFNLTRAADPAPKLYYNDYNIENVNAKQQKTVELVKYVQQAGAPIDGVGMQGHFIVGSMPSQADLENAANQYTALGVEVAYTEFDIKFTSLPYNAAGLESQAQSYVNVIKACLNVEGCVGWTIWDWTDKYSWVPGTFPGQGGACLWDDNFEPKPAYYSVSSALAAAATGSPSSSSAALPATTSPASSAAVSTSAAGAANTTAQAATSAASASSTNAASAVLPSSQAWNGTAVIPTVTVVPSGGVIPTPFLPPNATALFPNSTVTFTRPARPASSVAGGASAVVPSGAASNVPGGAASSAPAGAIGGSAGVEPTQPAGANPTTPVANGGGNAASPTPSAGGGPDAAVTPAPSYTTTTIYATSIYTVTSCAADVPDCPARIGSVTTEVVTITTTVPCTPTAPAAGAGGFVPGHHFGNGTIPSVGPKPSTLTSVMLGTAAQPAATPLRAPCKRRLARRHALVATDEA